MDITFDIVKKAMEAKGTPVMQTMGGAVNTMSSAPEDKILQYMGKFNDIMRTANDLLSNVGNLKNNPAIGELTGRVMAAKNVTPASSQMMMESTNEKKGGDVISANRVFSDIKDIVNMVKETNGDMTLTQVAEFLDKNSHIVIGFLKGKGYA